MQKQVRSYRLLQVALAAAFVLSGFAVIVPQAVEASATAPCSQAGSTITCTPGTGTYTPGAGIVCASVQAWGGGGGGGGGAVSFRGAGGGGGGAAHARGILDVTPGTTYTVTVGPGGAAGAAGVNAGGAGGTSSVTGDGGVSVTAPGGSGGAGAPANAGGAGGAGGTGATGIFTSNGGSGANGVGGTSGYSGGGGAAGGSSGNGASATGSSGAPGAGGGGSGGTGWSDPNANGAGNAGAAPGGGGSGGFAYNTNTGGSAGGAGRVVLTELTVGSLSAIRATPLPRTVPADGATPGRVVVQATDAQGCSVTQSGLSVSLVQTSGSPAAITPAGPLTTDSGGRVTFYVRSSSIGAVGLRADQGSLSSSTTVSFVAPTCTRAPSPNSHILICSAGQSAFTPLPDSICAVVAAWGSGGGGGGGGTTQGRGGGGGGGAYAGGTVQLTPGLTYTVNVGNGGAGGAAGGSAGADGAVTSLAGDDTSVQANGGKGGTGAAGTGTNLGGAGGTSGSGTGGGAGAARTWDAGSGAGGGAGGPGGAGGNANGGTGGTGNSGGGNGASGISSSSTDFTGAAGAAPGGGGSGAYAYNNPMAGGKGGDGRLVVTESGPSELSTVQATPTGLATGQASTVTVHLDSLCSDAGVPLELRSSRAGDTITSSPATTDANGDATFQVEASTCGVSTYTASARGVNITDTVDVMHSTTAGPASAAKSQAEGPAGSVVADDTTLATVVVTAFTAADCPLAGAQVTLTSDRGSVDHFTANPVTTDSSGRATFTLRSGDVATKGGVSTLSAVVAGIPVTQKATVTWVEFSGSLSFSAPPRDTALNLPFDPVIEVAARLQDGSLYTAKGLEVELTISGGAAGAKLVNGPGQAESGIGATVVRATTQAGIARFSGLAVNAVGNDYVLTASTNVGVATPVASEPFDVARHGNPWPQPRANAARTGDSGAVSDFASRTAASFAFAGGNVESSPVIADLNGDGRLDLVAVNEGAAPTARAYLMQADGTLPAAASWTNALATGGLAAGDATLAVGNVDSNPQTVEVVVYYQLQSGTPASAYGALKVLKGADGSLIGAQVGGGGSPAASPFYYPASQYAPLIANVIASSSQDEIVIMGAVTAEDRPDRVAVLRFDGTNFVQDSIANIPQAAAAQFPQLVAADFDSGRAGLEIAAATVQAVNICLASSGSLSCPTSVAIGAQVRGLSAADLDDDGDVDLAVNTNAATNPLVIVRNNGATAPSTVAEALGSGPSSNAPTLADVDRDGDVEIFQVEFGAAADDDVMVRSFSGSAVAGPAPYAPAGNIGGHNGGGALVRAGGLGDATADFVVVHSSTPTIAAYASTGAAAPTQLWSSALATAPTGPIAVGDLSGDCRADVAYGANAAVVVVQAAAATAASAPRFGTPIDYTQADTWTGVLTVEPGKARLAWNAPASDGGLAVVAYNVYRADTATGSYGLVGTWASGTPPTAGNPFVDSRADGKDYHYKVTAVNCVGESAQSVAFQLDGRGGTNPTGLVTSVVEGHTPVYPGEAQVKVDWTAAVQTPRPNGCGSTLGHKVYGGTTSPAATLLGTLAAGATTFTTSGASQVTEGQVNYFRITTTNCIGEGTGAEVSVDLRGPGEAPGTPSVSTATPGQVDISWTAPTTLIRACGAIEGYAVLRHPQPSGSSQLAGYAQPSGTNWPTTPKADPPATSVSGVPLTFVDSPGAGDFKYTVAAVNCVAVGTESAASATATVSGVPSAPASLTLTPGKGKVTASWGASSPGAGTLDKYELWRSNDATVDGSAADVLVFSDVPAFAMTKVDATVTNGNAYHYGVRAHNTFAGGSYGPFRTAGPVTPQNTAPVATPQTVAAFNEDTAKAITLAGTDADGDTLVYSIVTAPDPAKGALSGSPPSVTYTPVANFCGSDSFTFRADDGTTGDPNRYSTPATVSISVTCVNDAPVAAAGSYTTSEETAVVVTLSSTDVDGGAPSYAVASGPGNGVLSGSGSSRTYTPNANYCADAPASPDSFTYTANDGAATSTAATVTVRVTCVNDAPTGSAQTVAVTEDVAKAFSLAGTDVETASGSLTYTIVTAPAAGSLSAGTGPSRTYTPLANSCADQSFTYTVSDGAATSPAYTVTLDLGCVNDAPVAQDQTAATTENDPPIGITLVATDVDNAVLTYSIVQAPTLGSLTGTPPNVNYQGSADTCGTDTFTFRADDGTVGDPNRSSNTATVTVEVDCDNQRPVSEPKSATLDEDCNAALNDPVQESCTNPLVTSSPTFAGRITLHAAELENENKTYAIVSPPSNGSLTAIPEGTYKNEDAGPVVTYTPYLNFCGTDLFTYRADDESRNGLPATVTITVVCHNDRPTATAQTVAVTEDTTTGITLSGTDVDGDSLTYTVASQPATGALSGSGAALSFSPALNDCNDRSFTFTVGDASLTSAAATVSLGLTCVNDAPVVADGTFGTVEDTAGGLTLAASDVDSSSFTFTVLSAPAKGVLTGTGAARTYTPNSDACGADSFTYRANDGAANSNTGTIAVTLACVNDAPTAVLPAALADGRLPTIGAGMPTQSLQGAASVGPGGGTDESGQAVTFAASSNDNPALFLNEPTLVRGTGAQSGQGTLSYRGTASGTGTAHFCFDAKDNGGTADGGDDTGPELCFDLTILPNNQAPTVTLPTVAAFTEGGSTTLAGATRITVGDPDGGSMAHRLTLSLPAGKGNLTTSATTATVVGGAVGTGFVSMDGTLAQLNAALSSLLVVPQVDACGQIPLSVTIDDLNDGTANYGAARQTSAVLAVPVTCVNDAPTVVDDTLAVLEDAAGGTLLPVLANDLTAPDIGESLGILAFTQPEHGTVTLAGTQLRYTPDPNYFGPDVLNYTARDDNLGQGFPSGLAATATVRITVNPVNDAPYGVPDSYLARPGVKLTVAAADGLLRNDGDIEGSPLSAQIAVAPAHGTATVRGDGGFDYQSQAGFQGTDSFTYRASDGGLTSAPTTVTLNVKPNSPPSVTVRGVPSQGVAGQSAAFIGTASDDVSVASCTWDLGDGTTTQDSLAVHGYPNPGTYTVTYTCTDHDGAAATATLAYRVVAPNSDGSGPSGPRPVVSAGADQSVLGSTPVRLKATSSQGTQFLWSQVAGPAVSVSSLTTATVDFTAPGLAPGEVQVLVFQVYAEGNGQLSEPDTVEVRVSGRSVFEVSLGAERNVVAGEAVQLVAIVDGGPAALSWSVVSGPSVALAPAGDGVTFTAPAGPAELVIRVVGVADGRAAQDDVTVHVAAAPAIAPDLPDLPEIEVATDRSVDGNGPRPVTFTAGSVPAGAGVEWDFGDGRTSTDGAPTHAYDEPGTYTVRLTVTQDDGSSVTTQRTVQVEGQASQVRGEGLSPLAWGWIGFGAFALVGGAVAAFAWFRKPGMP